MSSCKECRDKTALYLDNALIGKARENFADHMLACENCRTYVGKEEELSRILHASRPLYVAPLELRLRVESMLLNAPGPESGKTSWRGFWGAVTGRGPSQARLVNRKSAVGLFLLIITSFALFTPVERQVRAATYVRAAVDAHHGYEGGNIPLELRSGAPGTVSSWIAQRVPFHFQLPEAESSPERQAAYRLTGASILDFKEKKVALVIYQMRTKTISLLIAPSDSAIIAGGEEVRFGKLAFHYRNNGDLQVITWSNHGLAYALVSPGKSSAQQSCLVCHQDMADHGSFPRPVRLSFPTMWEMNHQASR